jgi:hypothetical protein
VIGVDLKSLKCQPCNQKANNWCMIVATINNTDAEFMPSPTMDRQLEVLPEEGEADELGRPQCMTVASEGILPKATKKTTSPVMPVEMKRHSSWSIKSIRRWASISSLRTV